MDGIRYWLTHRYTVRFCQLSIGVIMGVAGLAKIGNLEAFATDIHNFRAWPVFAENVLAMVLPWIELVAALALILGIRARAAAWLSLALLVVFTGAVAQAVARDISITCGCFGKAGAQQVGVMKLLENSGMIVLAWIATRVARTD